MITIHGRVYGSPARDDDAHTPRVRLRIISRDPDNPWWLLDTEAYADGPLAERIAADYTHGSMIAATGDLTRTSPLPGDRGAGNTSALLALTTVAPAP